MKKPRLVDIPEDTLRMLRRYPVHAKLARILGVSTSTMHAWKMQGRISEDKLPSMETALRSFIVEYMGENDDKSI